MARRLGTVPSLVFLLFATLSSCVFLLEVFPTSTLLWWINIEVFSKFRAAYYLVEIIVSSSPVLTAVIFLTLALLTMLATRRARLSQLFLLNHIAAILIGVSLFSGSAPELVSANAALVEMGAGIPFPRLTASHSANLILLLASLGSCGACHLALLRRRSKGC